MTIIIIAVIVIALGLIARNLYRARRKRKRNTRQTGIDGSTPVPDQLRIISPFFGLFNRANVADYAEFVKRWGGNATRVFAYHDLGWDGGEFVPWDGPLSNIVKLEAIRDAIKTFNERGIIVILTLFQTNGSFGQGIVARPEQERAAYVANLVAGTNDLAVIYETTNEWDDHAFNVWTLGEIRKHVPPQSRRTCAYHNPAIGADWTYYHTAKIDKYDNRGFWRIILSNDKSPGLQYMSDADLIRWIGEANTIRPIGSFELLMMWHRAPGISDQDVGGEGFMGDNIPAMEKAWNRVLEAVRILP